MSMMSRRRRKNREIYLDEHPGLFDSLGVDETPLTAPVETEGRPERLAFISFGSGSSGNCAYIGTSSGGVLIDAGVDSKYVFEQLARNAVDPATIAGIILTHDHGDHVKYAYAILRYNKHMKLFATPRTLEGILRRHCISRRIADYHKPIYKEFTFKAGGLDITPFETSHDGTDNVGYYICGAGTSFVVNTDTGTITSRADYYIRRCRHLMIEANYDADMLRRGPYTERLKARIASATGHLDNADTARYVAAVAKSGSLRRLFLCHLSDENNTPATALAAVRDALLEASVKITTDTVAADDERLALRVLPRREASPLTVLI